MGLWDLKLNFLIADTSAKADIPMKPKGDIDMHKANGK
jgi:hypothetical protein